ncbi:unnamed protein product [Brachionus calyciflorus]|uniref:Uncharacterized protein n=1 Tax=Brachionus calyciflorus TaxID=104777 RepID=A0A814PK48_9BILA|nr:unnamed protein product [Brachionus calyciflorus]
MIKSQIENANQILSGFINFNHFTKAKENMNKTSLLTALKRCAAFHCKYGQKVIDLVIPVSLNIDNFDSISVVVIQVKLVNEPNEPKYSKIEEKFDPGLFLDFSKDVPFVFLYMQLGAPKNKVPYIKNIKDKNSVDPNSQYIAIIYSQGISREIFPIINKSLEQKMLAFADSNEKLFKIKDDVTKKKNLDKNIVFLETEYIFSKINPNGSSVSLRARRVGSPTDQTHHCHLKYVGGIDQKTDKVMVRTYNDCFTSPYLNEYQFFF